MTFVNQAHSQSTHAYTYILLLGIVFVCAYVDVFRRFVNKLLLLFINELVFTFSVV